MKFFNVIRMTKEDIRVEMKDDCKKGFLDWVNQLDDDMMERIAMKTGGSMMDDFWLSLRAVVESFYEDTKHEYAIWRKRGGLLYPIHLFRAGDIYTARKRAKFWAKENNIPVTHIVTRRNWEE